MLLKAIKHIFGDSWGNVKVDCILDNIIRLMLNLLSIAVLEENVLTLRRYSLMYLDVRYRDACNLQMVQLNNVSVCECAYIEYERQIEGEIKQMQQNVNNWCI